MYAVEKKFDIEMKLKREMNNILELKLAANRSSALASDVCNVLGACEQRLQQLETAVLPLYGDTAKMQRVYHNMELTVKSLDNVINYYMVSRELAPLIQAGPHTSSKESLNAYTDALDKLAEAQKYFNENNPQSVELENINQLYDSGVRNLENAFEVLLTRNTSPLSPTALMDMIALEEDSSVDSFSVSNSSTSSAGLESMRAAAAWLSACGRPPFDVLLSVRSQANKSSLSNFKDHLRTQSMRASPLMRSKQPHRSDSTKKPNKIKKGIEKRVNDIMSLAIGPRRSMNDSYSEEPGSELLEEWECECCGSVAAALCRLVRAEQRYLLGLVPMPRLTSLTQQVMKDCFVILTQDVERACSRYRRLAARCSGAGAGGGWSLLARLTRLTGELERASDPAAKLYQPIRAACQLQCLGALDDWLEGLRSDTSAPPVDGTVHQLTVSSLALLHQLAEHVHTLGPALATQPAYTRAASQILGAQDRDAVMLSIYMRKVLAQLNSQLRSKSEQYPDALKAIFLLNNINHLLSHLRPEQGSNLLSVLSLAEPDCEANYTDMMNEYRHSYLQSWNKLISHTTLDEPIQPGRLRDKDRQILKDKFASFNREFEECTKSQRGYAVPDTELREALKRANKGALLPPYSSLHDQYAALPFSKNPHKYIKYSPLEISTQLDGYFDESA